MANQEQDEEYPHRRRPVEWNGEEDFATRCRLTTIGNKIINKHLGSIYGVTYYAKDEYNKRNSIIGGFGGFLNNCIYVYKPTDNEITFYCISYSIINKTKNDFRIEYNMKVETNYEDIIKRCGEVGKGYIEDLMIETGIPQWIELVRVRREAEEEYLVERRRLAREQMVRDDERNIRIHQIQAEEHREILARVQRAQEEDHNDILRQAQEALERAQTELRREREMMAEFVEVFAPEPAIVPHFGDQLDLVPTPVPFVPEEPPNA